MRRERKYSSSEVPGRRKNIWIYLLLAVSVLAIYWQVGQFGFVNYDDPDYVSANPHIDHGLTADGVVWAFKTGYVANWLPLTSISHMLDVQLFGLDSGWHHLVNLLLHLLSTLLLFAFLERVTRAPWRSAIVAFLFALHPLHVESVAWIAERKGVLSSFFFFLGLWLYARYVERPGSVRYSLVLVSFAFGLLAKPMLVTFPLVLLLLDIWPLKRTALREKIPFFALAVVFSLVTYLVHAGAGGTASFALIPAPQRIANAIATYAIYLLQTFWPLKLAVFYPYPSTLELTRAIAALIALIAITVLVVRSIRSKPYLAVGWFWYLVTLAPVLGLVQVGAQARADRYTYLPLIGIFIILTWGAADLLKRWPRAQAGAAVAAILVCAALTSIQLQYWQNSITLFEHAIDVTNGNYVARMNLASALQAEGKTSDEITQLREVVRLLPAYSTARWELGAALAEQGQREQALQELEQAVRLNPNEAGARFNLGLLFGDLGKPAQAAAQLKEAVRLEPANEQARYNLGNALAASGDFVSAAAEFNTAIALKPEDAGAHLNLGSTLASLGRLDEAIVQFKEALRLQPYLTQAQQNLDYALSLKANSARK